MVKTEHLKVLSHTTNPKNQYFTTTTLKFGLVKCSVTILYECSHPFGLGHLARSQQDRVTKSRNQKPRQVMHIRDQSLRAQQYIVLRRSHGQVTKVPSQALHITTEYPADSRNRTVNQMTFYISLVLTVDS